MGIEELHRAAEAAGYAMATQDEPTAEPVKVVSSDVPATALPVVWSKPAPIVTAKAWDMVTSAGGWVRGHLPGFGGRAPA